MSLKDKIKSSPALKSLAQWALQAPNQYRPRWWIRNIVNPFVHKVSGKAIIRWNVRKDLFPFRQFNVGPYCIIEDYTMIANACGDVIMGEKVLVGVGCKLTGPITLGNNILLAQNVLISGLNHDFSDPSVPIVHQGYSVKEIVIEDGVWIGGGAIITPGVHIGRNSVVGAGSVVTKDVPPYSVAIGNPARVVKQYDFELKQWVKVNQNSNGAAWKNGVTEQFLQGYAQEDAQYDKL
jgi:acetyltransferase-like isoleucine patch superfamily enzyme